MSFAKNQAGCLNLRHIGWKYYNSIKKKAVEQEFSWSGLLTGLSIAFFIVAISALMLKFILLSLEAKAYSQKSETIHVDSVIAQN